MNITGCCKWLWEAVPTIYFILRVRLSGDDHCNPCRQSKFFKWSKGILTFHSNKSFHFKYYSIWRHVRLHTIYVGASNWHVGSLKSNLISSVYVTLGKMPKTSSNKPKTSFHRFFFFINDILSQGKIPNLLQSSLLRILILFLLSCLLDPDSTTGSWSAAIQKGWQFGFNSVKLFHMV